MYPEGGYQPITPIQLANALAALDAGAITFRAFRVYLGCFELVAIREAARRVRTAAGTVQDRPARFRPAELVRLLGEGTEAGVRRELKRLAALGLLTTGPGLLAVTETPLESNRDLLPELACGRRPTRNVPVPRRVLVFLCRSRKPALVRTALAYLLRGLALERGTGAVKAAGTVKISWISSAFGISERAARASRAELIRLGLIAKDTGSHQRKLNRDGAYFRINLCWAGGRTPGRLPASPVDNPPLRAPGSAPLGAEIRPAFAPPVKRPETPPDLKTQKLAPRDGPGVRNEGRRVTLRNIRRDDLRRVSSLRTLHRQAVAARWLPPGEAGFLNFAAAAVHANRASGDAVRIFVAVVRRGLWHHVTQADEDRARAAVARTRRPAPAAGTPLGDLLRRAAA